MPARMPAYTPPGSFPAAQPEPGIHEPTPDPEDPAYDEQRAPEPVYEDQHAPEPTQQPQPQQQYTPPASIALAASPGSSPVPVRLANASGGRHSFSGPSLTRSGDGEGTASSPDVRVWQQQAVAKLSGKSAADLLEEQRAEQEAAFLLAQGIFLAGYAVKRGGGSTKFGRKSWKKRYFVLDNQGLSYYTMVRIGTSLLLTPADTCRRKEERRREVALQAR